MLFILNIYKLNNAIHKIKLTVIAQMFKYLLQYLYDSCRKLTASDLY